MNFQVVASTPYWSLNGVNAFTVDLLTGLASRGVSCQVLLTDPDPFRRLPMSEPAGLHFERLNVSSGQSMPARREIFRRYLEEKAPCVYLPNYDYAYSCVSTRLSKKIRIAGIVHSDDPEHYEHVRRLGSSWDSIVCVSEAVRRRTLREIQGRFAPSDLRTIPYGVDFPVSLQAREPRTEPLKIIYAGRMARYQKRIQDIYSAAEMMFRKKIPCEWTLAGDGLDRAGLEKKFQTLKASGVSVNFTGVLARSELLALFGKQDVFILTSDFEGLPLALIEAMGQGCVPVASRTESGIPEVLRDGVNGYSVPTGNIPAFAECLEKLYLNPALRSKLSETARSDAQKKYSRDRMVEDYLALFQDLFAKESFGLKRHPDARILTPPLWPSDPLRMAAFVKTGGLLASHWMKKKLRVLQTSGKDSEK